MFSIVFSIQNFLPTVLSGIAAPPFGSLTKSEASPFRRIRIRRIRAMGRRSFPTQEFLGKCADQRGNPRLSGMSPSDFGNLYDPAAYLLMSVDVSSCKVIILNSGFVVSLLFFCVLHPF